MENNELYINILKNELIPALGCTEPIAIAFGSAYAKKVLGNFPDKIEILCSGNIIKNVKGVIVPTTKDLKGISAAAVLGAFYGNSDYKLLVLKDVKESDIDKVKELLKNNICTEKLLQTKNKLHIQIKMYYKNDYSFVEIIGSHDSIVKVILNDKVLIDTPVIQKEELIYDLSKLNLHDIYQFSTKVDICKIEQILEKQIECNQIIANEGMKNFYGANIGKVLIENYGDNIKIKARAYAAAGSDARMSGCELPVIINSGSGNQGITVSIPIILYAKELNVTKEKLIRALCLSNLVAIYQKSKIGRLSAFCGVVSAAAAAGGAIAYLFNENFNVISNTISNTLGIASGIVCDGAKPSCAAKIASSLDAAILGFEMAKSGNNFKPQEGLIKDDIEQTIECFAKMAKDGMRETDEEILRLMTQ